MTTTPAALEDVTEFRRQLMTASTSWHRRFEAAMTAGENANPGDCMAASYAYTLAATLKVIEVEVGTEAAERVGRIALEILENGDFDDWNADVSGLDLK